MNDFKGTGNGGKTWKLKCSIQKAISEITASKDFEKHNDVESSDVYNQWMDG